jgi:hypothetical protein
MSTNIVRHQHALFDAIRENFIVKNEFELACALNISRTHVAKLRMRLIPVTDEVILSAHDATGWPISKIKELVAESKLQSVTVRKRQNGNKENSSKDSGTAS